jgi:hypothetical protein
LVCGLMPSMCVSGVPVCGLSGRELISLSNMRSIFSYDCTSGLPNFVLLSIQGFNFRCLDFLSGVIYSSKGRLHCLVKYSVIKKDGLNFVRLYFLHYTWYVNDQHNI